MHVKQHVVVTGFAAGGLDLLREVLTGFTPEVDLAEIGIPAEDVMGRNQRTMSFCESDLFKALDLVGQAKLRDTRLDMVVVLRDPRDLLLGLGDAEGRAMAAADLIFLTQFMAELSKAGVIERLLFIRVEDLITSPDDIQQLLENELGVAISDPIRNRVPTPARPGFLGPAPVRFDAAGAYRPAWNFLRHFEALGPIFLDQVDLFAVVSAQGYARDPLWFAPVQRHLMLTGSYSAPDASAEVAVDPHHVPARDEIEVLYDDPLLRITRIPGEGSLAVITFIGVGLRDGGIDTQGEEFRRLGQTSGPQVFVFDKTRSWGNAISLETIAQITAPMREGRRTVVMGLSMGGFLAIWASRRLEADVCIALAPQYSMHVEIAPFERRWSNYTSEIETWIVPSLEHAFEETCRYYCIFSNDRIDQMHAGLFPTTPNVMRIFLDRPDHNVATTLKQADRLYPVLWACIRGESPSAFPLRISQVGRDWIVTTREASPTAADQRATKG